MCWQCDNPGSTRLDYLDHIRELIACHGWAVQGVERERVRPPWAYTVGLTSHGKPELVVTGLPLSRATLLLNDVDPPCNRRQSCTSTIPNSHRPPVTRQPLSPIPIPQILPTHLGHLR